MIGKRGLSYRGTSSNEAVYTLNDHTIDHGTFLETVILLSKYDPILKLHVDSSIDKSKLCHNSGSKQGDGTLTFLSKTTVGYILDTCSSMIKSSISKEVIEAGMYSIQLDTTQDTSISDQCSIIIRYVSKLSVIERLIAMVKCKSSTGEAFVELLLNVLKTANIDILNCVGNSTDGAANMQGQYRGFSAKLSETGATQLHIWCYAHVLNLVICDVTENKVEALSLFGLLNSCAVFIRESYKRMDIWLEKCSNKRLGTIGQTRWWAKDIALSKIFGRFNEQENSLYIELITTLDEILYTDSNIKSDIRYKSKGLLESLCKYETILTAQTFLRIFKYTTHLSKYLQTRDLDLLQAHRMVTNTISSIKDISRDFSATKEAADKFVQRANIKLELLESNLTVEDSFPEVRQRKKKRLFSYESEDEQSINLIYNYECNVYNSMIDTIINSLGTRFEKHGQICADFSCLDPQNFKTNTSKFFRKSI